MKNYKKIGVTFSALIIIFVTLTFIGTNVISSAVIIRPLIATFKASSTSIKSGDTVVLSWTVFNAKEIQILGIEKTPEAGFNVKTGSLEVWPLATTTYVLIAISSDGTVSSRSVTVNVDQESTSPKPIINYFWTLKKTVNEGDTIKLWWNTAYTSKVEIIGIEKTTESTLPLTGSLELWPFATTTYILNAYGNDGSVVSKSLTVNVNPLTTVVPTLTTAIPTQTSQPTTAATTVPTTSPVKSIPVIV